MHSQDEVGLEMLRAQRKFRCELKPDTAERLIGRVSLRYGRGETFRDALNSVMNRVEWPDRQKRKAYRQVIGAVLGRRGGLAIKKKAA